MTEIEKFEKLKELGYVYEAETGLVKRDGEVRGTKNQDGYTILTIFDEKIYRVMAHRYIWWLNYNKIPKVIDHINRVPDDNRLENLRNTTQNKNTKNTFGKGYRKNGSGFQARIKVDYKEIYLGQYKTKQEAEQAYLDAKKIYHRI